MHKAAMRVWTLLGTTWLLACRTPGEPAAPPESEPAATATLSPSSTATRASDLLRARKNVADLDRDYGAGLVCLLDSANPYDRKLALERFIAVPDLLPSTAPVRARLLELLEDDTAVYSDRCVEVLGEADTSPTGLAHGEGAIYAHAQCTYGEPETIGKLVLNAMKREDLLRALPAEILARATARPSSVPALAPLLQRTANLQSTTPPILEAAAAAPTAEVQAALLTLSRSLRYDAIANLDPLAGLMRSPSLLVRRRAAAAVLHFSRDGHALHGPAIEIVTAALADDSTDDVLADVATPAAEALAPQIFARYLRDPQRSAALEALAATRAVVPAAVPVLIRELTRRDGHLGEPALQVLAAFGTAAKPARAAVIAHAHAQPRHLALACRALAAMDIAIDGASLAALARVYHDRCDGVGEMPEFSLAGDEECGLASEALEALAVASMRARLGR